MKIQHKKHITSILYVHKHSLNKYIAEVKHKKILILRRSFPATSYVSATFHPTTGQCAPQSLNTNATPRWA